MTAPLTLITGALGTIGKAAAVKLSGEGHALFLLDRDEDALRDFSTHLPDCAYRAVDVTAATAVADVFHEMRGRLENVILCAGIEGPVGNFEEIDDDMFHNVINVNVFGVWLGIKHALRALKPKNRGSIVVLSSISGTMGMPAMAPYCASKHAVMGLVRTAAREAAGSGVRVNAVCPGPVASDMMKRIDADLVKTHPDRLKGRKDASASVPMQRYAHPQEIADTLAFLCSDASTYITGTAMMVDGGLTCR